MNVGWENSSQNIKTTDIDSLSQYGWRVSNHV
jgi:hypothetical protein